MLNRASFGESCMNGKPRVCYFSESENKLNLDSVNLYVGHNTMGVFCEDLGENWLRCNGTVLYKTPGGYSFCESDG